MILRELDLPDMLDWPSTNVLVWQFLIHDFWTQVWIVVLLSVGNMSNSPYYIKGVLKNHFRITMRLKNDD